MSTSIHTNKVAEFVAHEKKETNAVEVSKGSTAAEHMMPWYMGLAHAITTDKHLLWCKLDAVILAQAFFALGKVERELEDDLWEMRKVTPKGDDRDKKTRELQKSAGTSPWILAEQVHAVLKEKGYLWGIHYVIPSEDNILAVLRTYAPQFAYYDRVKRTLRLSLLGRIAYLGGANKLLRKTFKEVEVASGMSSSQAA